MKPQRIARLFCSATLALLACATAYADKADITTGVPTQTGNVVIDIIFNPGNGLIKSSTLNIPAGITPAEKAALIYTQLLADVNASPLNGGFVTVNLNVDVITITDAALGRQMTVTIIADGTKEGTELQAYPGGLTWWQKAWRWVRRQVLSMSTQVVPAGASATVSFDSPAGFQTRTVFGDGVKTVAELQAELSSSLAAAGLTFTTVFVSDPVDGDAVEYISQPMSATMPTLQPGAFQVSVSPEWSEYFGTMGIEIDAPPLGTPFCGGDGSTPTACPCGNMGMQGHGCNNSANTGGSQLTASGTTSPDTVVLSVSNELPNALSIFLQGNVNLAQGAPFGDGVRCASGNLKRLGVKSAVNGSTYYPQNGDPGIRNQSALLGDTIQPGAVRYYQVYYRDPNQSFCPAPQGNTWNVSNGVAIQWQ
jgi:hypothetical protein